LKCISGNYSIAGNRGHLACFRRYLIELELELIPNFILFYNSAVRPHLDCCSNFCP